MGKKKLERRLSTNKVSSGDFIDHETLKKSEIKRITREIIHLVYQHKATKDDEDRESIEEEIESFLDVLSECNADIDQDILTAVNFEESLEDIGITKITNPGKDNIKSIAYSFDSDDTSNKILEKRISKEGELMGRITEEIQDVIDKTKEKKLMNRIKQHFKVEENKKVKTLRFKRTKKLNTEKLTRNDIQKFINQHLPRLQELYREIFPDIKEIQIQTAKKTFVTIGLSKKEK